jgi:polysaccharide pyruvyl transferase WcaK-like protein
MGVPEENYRKFRRFIEYLLSDENCLVSVRNDGSKGNIKEHFGERLAERVSVVPDGGFFLEVSDSSHPELPNDKDVIGINVAIDMVDRRFPDDGSNDISYEEFVVEFGNLLNELLGRLPNHDLIFFPHIHSDLRAIADVLEEVDTLSRRSRLTVAPLLHGFGSAEYVFNIYKSCDLMMGMRFHSNVPSIGLKTPSIGLSSYPQIANLYDELGIAERAVSINNEGFRHELEDLVFETIENQTVVTDKYGRITDSLELDVAQFHSDIDGLLSSRGL